MWENLLPLLILTIAQSDVCVCASMMHVCRAWQTVCETAKPRRLTKHGTISSLLYDLRSVNCSLVQHIDLDITRDGHFIYSDETDQAILASIFVSVRRPLYFKMKSDLPLDDWLYYLPHSLISVTFGRAMSCPFSLDGLAYLDNLQHIDAQFDSEGEVTTWYGNKRLEHLDDIVIRSSQGARPSIMFTPEKVGKHCIIRTDLPASCFPLFPSDNIQALP